MRRTTILNAKQVKRTSFSEAEQKKATGNAGGQDHGSSDA